MRTADPVALHPFALRAWPFLPASAPPGSWWLGDCGELVRIEADGTASPLEGFSSVAQDPCAGRRPGTAGTAAP